MRPVNFLPSSCLLRRHIAYVATILTFSLSEYVFSQPITIFSTSLNISSKLFFHSSYPLDHILPLMWTLCRPLYRIGRPSTQIFAFSASTFPKAPTSPLRLLKSPTFRFNRQFHHAPPRTAQYTRFNSNGGPLGGLNVPAILLFLQSRNAIYLLLGVSAFCIYNIDSAPVTGRLRLLWVPYSLEKMVGDYSYRQIMAQYGLQVLPTNNPAYTQVLKVMNKLLAAAVANTPDPNQKKHLELLDWSLHIIQVEPNFPPNAFILPNGKIFVFLLILPICKDANGLATVLSHELLHQLARHSLEQLSKQPFYVALLLLMYAATGTDSLLSLMINGVLKMPASRAMETEADHIGCNIMARLCFDIHQAENFWQRMHQWEKQLGMGRLGPVMEFFLTHPGTERRMDNIRLWMGELEQVRERLGCYDHQFGDFLEKTRNFLGLKDH